MVGDVIISFFNDFDFKTIFETWKECNSSSNFGCKQIKSVTPISYHCLPVLITNTFSSDCYGKQLWCITGVKLI